MPRRPNEKRGYSDKARKLRSLGYDVKYKSDPKSGTSKGSYKSAVTRLWDKAKFYAVNTERNRLEFKKFTKTNPRSKWAGHVSPDQLFPKGVYIQRPKGIQKGKYKIKLGKKGEIEIRTHDRRRVRDVVLRLDMQAISNDSRGALESTLANQQRPRQLLLTVNGFDADGNSFGDVEAFNRYLETDLVPHLEAASFNFKKYGKKVFGVKLVYSQKGQKKAEGEGTTFDFSTGGIFDAKSKRVYGTKRFLDRKRYATKKGKRKGT